MSNLESARAAIEAELSHARNGLQYYHSRIEALESMLGQLAGFQGGGAVPASRGKRGPKPGLAGKAGAKAAKPEKGLRRKGERKINSSGLPFTGGDFWENLVLDEPRSFPDILEAAIGKLEFEPTKQQVQKLSGRMIFAINALVKSGKIRDSGSGRARRFFK
ncbi:MAG TPA: hypothetical protein VF798_04480 [Burkholderiaceae bacterium]